MRAAPRRLSRAALIGACASLLLAIGCKQADKKKVAAYAQASTRTAQLFDALLKDRCQRVAKSSTWQSAVEDTNARYQEYVKSSQDAVTAYDALMKSDPPSRVLDQQRAASDAGKELSRCRDEFQKVCTERFGKGPELDRARAQMDAALTAYLAALRAVGK